MSREFRIEYTIQANSADGEEDWADIGFGSSGAWSDVDTAVHMVESDVQNRGWETEPGMPEPGAVDEGDTH